MPEQTQDLIQLEELGKARDKFFSEIGKVIIGQTEILNQMLIAMITRGHTLLVGVPGLAKTLLI